MLSALDVRGDSVRVVMAGQLVLDCDVDGLADGRVGVASYVDGAVEVITIAVTR